MNLLIKSQELILANKELAFQNEEKEKRAQELIIANKELAFQNEEKEKRAAELITANKELAFQNEEKEKRAHELIIASKELVFQNDEKEKRAEELIIANKELAFQNKEKEKRAAELIIANKELAFQNKEKEKRAAELIIANKELAFQNREKEKRAAELIIANKELAFQNEEKEKRAQELITANKELAIQSIEKEKRSAELIVANRLAFQNEDKEKRALELIITNKQLTLQNAEKERTAEELHLSIREFKAVEKQLVKVNKELEAFSYSVSHDLRAPLRAISGYSTMLKEDYESKLDTEANRIIDVVVKNASMMSELIDNLLSFSKMARLELVNDNVNMYNLAQTSVAELLQTEKDIKRSVTINSLPECKGDANMLKQVWKNLIDNALKYSSKKLNPKIEVGFSQNDATHIYYVKDNGAGFDMKYDNKLFGVFQRLHRQEEFEGTGLGLALAKRIVSKHGGEIWAEAILNEGAKFYFSIPKSITNEERI